MSDSFPRLGPEHEPDEPSGLAEYVMRHAHDDPLVIEAAEVAHGMRHLTVIHGGLTDPDSAVRMDAVLHAADDIADNGHLRTFTGRGSHGRLTLAFGPPDAEDAIAALEALVHELNPGHWTIIPH